MRQRYSGPSCYKQLVLVCKQPKNEADPNSMTCDCRRKMAVLRSYVIPQSCRRGFGKWIAQERSCRCHLLGTSILPVPSKIGPALPNLGLPLSRAPIDPCHAVASMDTTQYVRRAVARTLFSLFIIIVRLGSYCAIILTGSNRRLIMKENVNVLKLFGSHQTHKH